MHHTTSAEHAARERAERLLAAGAATATPESRPDGSWRVIVTTAIHDEPVHVLDDEDLDWLVRDLSERAA